MRWNDPLPALRCATVLLCVLPLAGLGSAHLDSSRLTRGCGSCHRGHGLSGTPMLPAEGAEACLQCHGGLSAMAEPYVDSAAAGRLKDLRIDFAKPYRHPIETAALHGIHESETAAYIPERRHAACVDCHDAHRPIRPPPRDMMRTSPKGSTLEGYATEYALCYRCHASSGSTSGIRDIAAELSPGNLSFHPVEAVGPATDVPSLVAPWTVSSRVACTDCHGSDDPAFAGTAHGSSHQAMLVDNYETRHDIMESDFAYALCYRCHDRQSILADEGFSEHRTHLVSGQGATSCHTCHAAHGSPTEPHLIRFNPAVVVPNGLGELRYVSLGSRSGECYLTCHRTDHRPGRYCDDGTCDPGTLIRGGPGSGTSGLSEAPQPWSMPTLP